MRWSSSTFHPRRSPMARRIVIGTVLALVVVAAIAFVNGRADAAASAALDDAAVVAIFDLANTADIETGQLAARRAENTEVRDFGRMLSDVHTQVRLQGRDLAKKLGVTPKLPADDQSAKNHAAVIARLGALKGAEFDKAFLEHEQAFHAAVLTAVKGTLLPAIQTKELKDFVVSLAPAFESHRLMADNLLRKTAPNAGK